MPIRISKNRVSLENIPLNEAKGADIASAGTVNLDSATGNLVHITGTTTITAITLSSGYERTVVFDGALTLTHNATTLILPGNANITTASGDRAVFRGDGSGNTRCISYTKASGTAVVGSANKNAIINGNFDIWQRGTSFTTNGYTADRFRTQLNGSTHVSTRQTFTVGQTDVPNEPAYHHRTVVTSVAGAGNYFLLQQRIESVRTYAGKTVTLSFYAKADASKNIAVEFEQNYGSGGTPSSGVSGIGVTTCALTTSWQRFTSTVSIPSISGKTLGTNNDDNLGLQFWFDAGSTYNSRTNSLGQQSGTFDIAQVQLEEGSSFTSFEYRPIGQEIALCQRYYEKSSNIGTDVSTVESFVGLASGAANFRWFVPFRTRKRTTPTITTYNSSVPGSTTTLRNYTAVSNETYSSISAYDSFYFLYHSSSTSNHMYTWSWVADAEL